MEMGWMIRILVADTEKQLIADFKKYLAKNEKDIKIVKVIKDGSKVEKAYDKYQPEVLIMELDLPNKNGVEIIDDLCMDTRYKTKCDIIVFSKALNKFIFNYMEKVNIVLDKNCEFSEVCKAIRSVYKFNNYHYEKFKL